MVIKGAKKNILFLYRIDTEFKYKINMKKKVINFLLLILIGGFSVACNDDDNNDNGLQLGEPELPGIVTPETVESIYHGLLVRIIEQQAGLDVKNVTDAPVKNNIILAKGEDNASMLTLKFQNLRFQNGAVVSKWEVPNISLIKDRDICYLIGETQDIMLWEAGKIGKVYVSGTVSGDSLHVTVDIKTPGLVGSYGMNMNFKFDGKAGHSMGTGAEITDLLVDKSDIVNKITLNQEKKEIVILVKKEVADQDLKFKAEIKASEGAYLQAGFYEYAGELDFTRNNLVTVKVSSEDGTVKEVAYKIYCIKVMDLNFTFDNWSKETAASKWEVPTGWASNNGSIYFGSMGKSEYAIQKNDGAALIKTLNTTSFKDPIMGTKFKKVTSGVLYKGTYNQEDVTSLGDNKVGILYKFQAKPLRLEGNYSYTAGEIVYDQAGNEVLGATDECLLAVYLYEVVKDTDILDAISIHTSDKVVARGEFTHGTTSGAENFGVPVVFKEDYVYDSAKTYKIAILLASSKDGHIYKGAPESTLIINKINVVTE